MNSQHDHMDEKDIKPPTKMPTMAWEQYEKTKGATSTQKRK
jgi:hypothetical protein